VQRKFRVRVNHFAAKTVDAYSASNKENLAVTTAILIFSGGAAYAGYTSRLGSLLVLSAIPFLASALILIFEIYSAIKESSDTTKID
jgi:hypothetical protein